MAEVNVIQCVIPDIFAQFPLPHWLNEHYLEVNTESTEWVESFRPFDEKGLQNLRKCDCSLLACFVFANKSREFVRLGCDLMHLLFVIDGSTDVTNREGANKIHNIVMDALRNPHKERPQGEYSIGAMAKDFGIRASNYSSLCNVQSLSHFIRSIDEYMAGVSREADDRINRRCRGFQDYLTLRLYTIGSGPTYGLCEFGLDLPEEVLFHPKMESLREQGSYLIAIANDIYSYPLEKKEGLEFHNSVELVMVEQDLDMQGAVDWLGKYAAGVLAGFIDNLASMPSWGEEIDRKAKIYIEDIAQVVRGTDEWSFHCRRYFGSKGLEIQKTRVIAMAFAAPKTRQ